MSPQAKEGLIVRFTGQEVLVDTGDGNVVRCLLRGRLRQQGASARPVAGDRVRVTVAGAEGGPGTVEEVLPRRTWLARYSPRDSGERVIVANVDRLFLVASVEQPPLRFQFIDRVLVAAENGHNAVTICVNKIDLTDGAETLDEFVQVYTTIGYDVLKMSADTGEGVGEVESRLTGGIYAFVGQSGVGKSSIMNRIDETLELRVGRVARKTGRGRHTTTFSQLYPINGGYVADTPGMQTFGYPGVDAVRLGECFPEFRPLANECRFQPCTHSHEPDCAVKAAVEKGDVFESRYNSYCDMLAEVESRNRNRF